MKNTLKRVNIINIYYFLSMVVNNENHFTINFDDEPSLYLIINIPDGNNSGEVVMNIPLIE